MRRVTTRKDLNGKFFTVTGGASGMGAATARLLCQRGAVAVCIGDYNGQKFSILDKELSAISPSTKIRGFKFSLPKGFGPARIKG
jgi:chanoclavine-I dehydrogenase